MSSTATTQNPKKAANPRGKSGMLSVILMVLVGAGAFFGGSWYMAERSSLKTALAAEGVSEQRLIVYRPASGILDKYLGEDPLSPTVSIPLGQNCRFLDAAGKKTSSGSLFSEEGLPKYVEVKLGPDGTVWSVKYRGDLESIAGETLHVEDGKIRVGKNDYYIGDALFILDGVVEEAEPVPVSQGDAVAVHAFQGEAVVVRLLERHGVINVNAPEGAGVYVDGVYRGIAPGEFGVSPGNREVIVKKPGFRDEKTVIEVVSGRKSTVACSLTPVTGSVIVRSTPPGASVYVGDDLMGKTPVTLNLSPGQHQLRVQLDGYYPKNSPVTVVKDVEKAVDVVLHRAVSDVDVGAGASGNLTITSVDPQSWTIYGRDGAERRVTLRLDESVTLDGWGLTPDALGRLKPGEEIAVKYGFGGRVEKITTTYAHSFVRSGTLMHVDGRTLMLGPSWLECSLSDDAVIRHSEQTISSSQLVPGDSITVYGESASDIRYVERTAGLGPTASFEGYVVRWGAGFKVFNDVFETAYDPPPDLCVADASSRTTVQLSQVGQGSKLRFYLDVNGEFVWAHSIYKTEVSMDGRINHIDGVSLYVGREWIEGVLNPDTAVFIDGKKTWFYDIRPGDTVVAGGMSSGDIKFIWVRDRPDIDSEIPAVVVSSSGREGIVAYELDSSLSEIEWPVTIGSSAADFAYPDGRSEVSPKELLPGDRVRLSLDEAGRPIWGQVLSKQDGHFQGRYLGSIGDRLYFSGFFSYEKAPDFLIVGLPEDHELYQGAKVAGSYKDGLLTYLEVRESLEWDRTLESVVLSSGRDTVTVSYRDGTTYECDKDAWFVDWSAEVDGDLSNLFPGDEVTYSLVDGRVYWVERTYSHPFKLEGTVQRIDGRTIVVGGKNKTQTLVVNRHAIVYRDGVMVSPYSIEEGDSVRVAGSRYDSIDVVVIGR